MLLLAACSVFCWAQSDPETGGTAAGQSVADALRMFADADGAFVAAGLLKQRFAADDLATILQYPTDQVEVVTLTGSQIKAAFERSLSLYPQPNASFLQVSGFEVTFRRAGVGEKRVISVTATGEPLNAGQKYTVAMPSSLARGGMGYFKVWDRTLITRVIDNTTVEQVLKDKKVVESPSRWLPRD